LKLNLKVAQKTCRRVVRSQFQTLPFRVTVIVASRVA
jgi:hypothetical protein